MKQIIILEGLNCPNCAARIEADVRKLAHVREANLNLMQQTLALEAEEDLFEAVEKIVHRYEPDVRCLRKSEPREETFDGKGMLLRMGIGAAIFAVGLVSKRFPVQLGLYIAAYAVLGCDVVLRALKNIVKGHVFDENFLMSLSSIGAFFIGEYPEAVAVMLF